jgi:hypothetical protein
MYKALISLIVLAIVSPRLFAEEKKPFQVEGVFSVGCPEEGYEWKKVKDIEKDGHKAEIYIFSKQGSTKLVVLAVTYGKVAGDQLRAKYVQQGYDGVKRGLQGTQCTIIEEQNPSSNPPIPDRVPSFIHAKAPNGGESYGHYTTIFGNNAFQIGVTAPTAEEAKDWNDKILKSFKELNK